MTRELQKQIIHLLIRQPVDWMERDPICGCETEMWVWKREKSCQSEGECESVFGRTGKKQVREEGDV